MKGEGDSTAARTEQAQAGAENSERVVGRIVKPTDTVAHNAHLDGESTGHFDESPHYHEQVKVAQSLHP